MVLAGMCASGLFTPAFSDTGKQVHRLIFDERRIEGKIRRPQLVFIKAEQRPEFQPMVMQSLGTSIDLLELARGSSIEWSPYAGAFEFNRGRVSNCVP